MSIKTDKPIGVFDSGIGGVTVLRSLLNTLPNEHFIYFGDTARVPYGSKSASTIDYYCGQITRFLLSHEVKAIVVACNTASSTSIPYIHSITDIPVFEVITPPAQAALATDCTSLGIIGTKRTIESGAYQNYIRKHNPAMDIYGIATPLFVPLIEEGFMHHPIAVSCIDHYLAPYKDKMNALILGCTHYPLLKEDLQTYLGAEVHIIDSATAIAESMKKELEEMQLCSSRKHPVPVDFYVSDPASDFLHNAPSFLGRGIKKCQVIDLAELQDFPKETGLIR